MKVFTSYLLSFPAVSSPLFAACGVSMTASSSIFSAGKQHYRHALSGSALQPVLPPFSQLFSGGSNFGGSLDDISEVLKCAESIHGVPFDFKARTLRSNSIASCLSDDSDAGAATGALGSDIEDEYDHEDSFDYDDVDTLTNIFKNRLDLSSGERRKSNSKSLSFGAAFSFSWSNDSINNNSSNQRLLDNDGSGNESDQPIGSASAYAGFEAGSFETVASAAVYQHYDDISYSPFVYGDYEASSEYSDIASFSSLAAASASASVQQPIAQSASAANTSSSDSSSRASSATSITSSSVDQILADKLTPGRQYTGAEETNPKLFLDDSEYGQALSGVSFHDYGNQDVRCPTCNASFPCLAKAQAHYTSHLAAKLFRCMICDNRHARRAGSLAHIKKHTNAEKLECLQRTYAIQVDETKKMELAEEDDPEDIDIASFVDEEEFRAVTEGVEGTACPTCDKPFPNVSQCKAHFATHVTDGAFKCLLCLSRYSRKAGCRDHIKQKHTPGERRMAMERLDELKETAKDFRIAKKIDYTATNAPVPASKGSIVSANQQGASRSSSATPPWNGANSAIPQQESTSLPSNNPYVLYGYAPSNETSSVAPENAAAAIASEDWSVSPLSTWTAIRNDSSQMLPPAATAFEIAVNALNQQSQHQFQLHHPAPQTQTSSSSALGNELIWIDESLLNDFLSVSATTAAHSKRRSISSARSSVSSTEEKSAKRGKR